MTYEAFFLACALIYSGKLARLGPDKAYDPEREMNIAVKDATELWRRSDAAIKICRGRA